MSETCEHDYRARFDAIGSVYNAVCEKCRHDAGRVDMSHVESIYGHSNPQPIDMGKVQCLDCGWQGKGYQLAAQACPVCDGRCADV